MTSPLIDVIAEAIRDELPLVPTTEVAVQAVLKALDQAGYVVVPKEPTPEMIEAGSNTPQMKIVNAMLSSQQVRTGVYFKWLGKTTETCALAESYRAMLSASKEG